MVAVAKVAITCVVGVVVGVASVGILLVFFIDANVSVVVCVRIAAVIGSAGDTSDFCNFCVADLGFCVEVNIGHVL